MSRTTREKPKITWRQAFLGCMGILAAIGDVVMGYALWKASLSFFLLAWARTTLKWSVVIFLGGVLWYKLWVNAIDKNEKYRDVPEVMNETYRKALFKPYGEAMCPKCETMVYYYITEFWQKDNAILTCPQCGHKFSFVWCEKCGMGGDFIQNLKDKPASWECPSCHTAYSLPPSIWEYPFETFPEGRLPYSTQLAGLYSQKQHEKKSALSVVWFFVGYVFLYTLMEPLERVLDQAFPPCGGMVSRVFVYSCFVIAVFFGFITLPFIPLWLWSLWSVLYKKIRTKGVKN